MPIIREMSGTTGSIGAFRVVVGHAVMVGFGVFSVGCGVLVVVRGIGVCVVATGVVGVVLMVVGVGDGVGVPPLILTGIRIADLTDT